MTKVCVNCDACGRELFRIPCTIFAHNFCNRTCYKLFYGPIFAELNRERNKTLMTPRVRAKLSEIRLDVPKGDMLKSYRKVAGRHEHRVVAEAMIGRALTKTEIVHHKDGNQRNNSRENLEVMSRKEHMNIHIHNKRKGGDKVCLHQLDSEYYMNKDAAKV